MIGREEGWEAPFLFGKHPLSLNVPPGKHPFFFLNPFKKSSSIPSKPTVQRVDSKKVSIDMGKIDVTQEVCLTSHIFGIFHVSLMFNIK